VGDAVPPRAIVEDPYAVLGIDADASGDAIRQAYRSKARTCHPDVTREPQAAARFRRLAAAYEILSDPDRRRAYDSGRATVPAAGPEGRRPSGPVAVHRAPRPTGAVITPPRPADAWARRAEAAGWSNPQGASPASVSPDAAASSDEWHLVSILGRIAAAAVLLVVVGVAVMALLTAVREDVPAVPTPFCRTPDGWIDCRRVLDPLTP
jgi:curved DNA-binding protein CbpA